MTNQSNLDLFFDPATKATVELGAQANTFAFGAQAQGGAAAEEDAVETRATGTCPPAQTVTVTAAASAPTADAKDSNEPSESGTSGRADTIITGALDFGLCTNPAVEFVSPNSP